MTKFDHEERIVGIEPDESNLAKYFAKIITSKHNQHALVRIVGKAGTGKSWAGLSLSIGVAEEVAKIQGGTPSDYFSMENDLGIISQPEIKRVMTNPKPYTIKFLDDVAVAWNARRYRDDFNIDLNDLVQTFRPNHNLVIMTLQAGFLIDKVPRSLVHFQIEMEQSLFDQGISLMKVFKLDLNEDDGKTYKHYLRGGGCKYIRHVSYAPSEAITTAYELERAKQLARMKEAKEEAKKPKEKPVKASEREKAMEVIRDVEAGIYPDMKVGAADKGVNYAYVRWVKSQAGMCV